MSYLTTINFKAVCKQNICSDHSHVDTLESTIPLQASILENEQEEMYFAASIAQLLIETMSYTRTGDQDDGSVRIAFHNPITLEEQVIQFNLQDMRQYSKIDPNSGLCQLTTIILNSFHINAHERELEDIQRRFPNTGAGLTYGQLEESDVLSPHYQGPLTILDSPINLDSPEHNDERSPEN